MKCLPKFNPFPEDEMFQAPCQSILIIIRCSGQLQSSRLHIYDQPQDHSHSFHISLLRKDFLSYSFFLRTIAVCNGLPDHFNLNLFNPLFTYYTPLQHITLITIYFEWHLGLVLGEILQKLIIQIIQRLYTLYLQPYILVIDNIQSLFISQYINCHFRSGCWYAPAR